MAAIRSMEPLSPPSPRKFMARSFRRFDSNDVVIQVLADELTIQLIADHVRIAIDTPLFEDQSDRPNRVRKAVLKITASIIAIVSSVVGLVDPSVGFALNKPFKLALTSCFLAVMVCFCFCLGLLMLSEMAEQPPISVSLARKLMLLVVSLVQLAVAMKIVSLLMEV